MTRRERQRRCWKRIAREALEATLPAVRGLEPHEARRALLRRNPFGPEPSLFRVWRDAVDGAVRRRLRAG